MPLWPGGPKVGLGLWYSKPATVMVESALLAAGLAIYLSARTRMNNVWGRVSLWSFVGLIVLAYVGALTGGPPPDSETRLALRAHLVDLRAVGVVDRADATHHRGHGRHIRLIAPVLRFKW